VAHDPFSELRDHLHAAVNDAIAGLDYSHSQLLGQQVSALSSADSDSDFLPGLLCAFTAEALGAGREEAMAAGTAFALVEAAAYVVDDLVAAGSGGDVSPRALIGAWGVPRTLNAADGFYALAHECLLSLHDLGIDAGAVLALAADFDAACRAWAEESEATLRTNSGLTRHPSPPLLRAAAFFGARLGGIDTHLADRVAAALGGPATDVEGLPLDAEARQALSSAHSYLAGVQQ